MVTYVAIYIIGDKMLILISYLLSNQRWKKQYKGVENVKKEKK